MIMKSVNSRFLQLLTPASKTVENIYTCAHVCDTSIQAVCIDKPMHAKTKTNNIEKSAIGHHLWFYKSFRLTHSRIHVWYLCHLLSFNKLSHF